MVNEEIQKATNQDSNRKSLQPIRNLQQNFTQYQNNTREILAHIDRQS